LKDDNGNVLGTGLTNTFDSTAGAEAVASDGYEASLVAGQARADTGLNIVEAAVLLSDYGLTLADFSNPLEYAYAGVAVSNPSSPISDLFANDEFSEAFGSGVEYDTILMGTAIPEPSTFLYFSVTGCAALFYRRRSRS